MRRFTGFELGEDAILDETTILNFRRLLEAHSLAERPFEAVRTLVDSTLIASPPSTKNETRARDPQITQMKKNSAWHFGMKRHVGVDRDSGLIHSVQTTTAKESRLHANERSVCAMCGVSAPWYRPEHYRRTGGPSCTDDRACGNDACVRAANWRARITRRCDRRASP